MTVENKANLLWGIVLVLMVATLGVVYYKYHDYFVPKTDIGLAFDPECNLRSGTCESSLPNGGKVSFSIKPENIPLLKPLSLEVRIAGMDASRVEVDFAGVDMNMGFNRNRLVPAGSGVYKGNATLPVCVRNKMDWEANVMLYTDAGLITAPYRFATFK